MQNGGINMRKQRLASIEKEVLRVVSTALFEDVKNPKVRGMVSLTKVRVTEDLKFQIFISLSFQWTEQR